MAERTCSVDGCGKPHRAKGLCSTHYNQQRPDRHRKVEVACDECGKPVLKLKRYDYHRRYCSEACRWAQAARTEAALRSERSQRHRVNAAQRLDRAATGSRGSSAWVSGPCAECGVTFTMNQPDSICCSEACHRRMSRRRAKDRRKARIRGNAHERVSRRRVYERDGWRCAICRRKTNPSKSVPHPRAPTLDHIVPVSAGGSHSYVNVQCACFECNWQKNAGTAPQGDQLRLIG